MRFFPTPKDAIGVEIFRDKNYLYLSAFLPPAKVVVPVEYINKSAKTTAARYFDTIRNATIDVPSLKITTTLYHNIDKVSKAYEYNLTEFKGLSSNGYSQRYYWMCNITYDGGVCLGKKKANSLRDLPKVFWAGPLNNDATDLGIYREHKCNTDVIHSCNYFGDKLHYHHHLTAEHLCSCGANWANPKSVCPSCRRMHPSCGRFLGRCICCEAVCDCKCTCSCCLKTCKCSACSCDLTNGVVRFAENYKSDDEWRKIARKVFVGTGAHGICFDGEKEGLYKENENNYVVKWCESDEIEVVTK